MKIFSKKSFRFDDPANQQEPVVVKAGDFATVPDWVSKTTMFKWANEAGDLSVIESRQDEKKATDEATTKASKRGRKPSDTDSDTSDEMITDFEGEQIEQNN